MLESHIQPLDTQAASGRKVGEERNQKDQVIDMKETDLTN